jgi:peptidoglycan/LPS O-acetylase OafA/YrhL
MPKRPLMIRMPQSANLDLLRSIAVAFVVLSHLRYFLGWSHEAVYSLETLGRQGVAIFFVHTTLVLLMSLERTRETFGAFMVRRVFRIYPLACTVVVLTSLPGLLGREPLDAGMFMSNLLLIQNVTGHPSSPQPLWTLPYELQMYLLLPALFGLTQTSRAQLWVATLCGSALVAAFAAFAAGVDFRLLKFFPCFLPGALAFVFWRPRLPSWILFAYVAASSLIIPTLAAAGCPELPMFWIFCMLLGWAVASCRPVTSSPLAVVGKTIATYSYGVYLTHIIALGLAFADGGRGPLEWLICLAALPTLAWIAYRYLEHPAIQMGRRFATARPARMHGV